MNLILALRHSIFLPYTCLRMFLCASLSLNLLVGEGCTSSDKMGHQLLPTLPLCPHFPLPPSSSPAAYSDGKHTTPLCYLSITYHTTLSCHCHWPPQWDRSMGLSIETFTLFLNAFTLFERQTAVLLVRIICSV